MSNRIPYGTVLEVEGMIVTVGAYIGITSTYRVSYAGPGHIAGAQMLEDVWRSTSKAELRRLKKEMTPKRSEAREDPGPPPTRENERRSSSSEGTVAHPPPQRSSRTRRSDGSSP